MNITVYLGSCEGNDPAMKRRLQSWAGGSGESGNRLVYGGSKTASWACWRTVFSPRGER